mgnify:CR=1 FL=1
MTRRLQTLLWAALAAFFVVSCGEDAQNGADLQTMAVEAHLEPCTLDGLGMCVLGTIGGQQHTLVAVEGFDFVWGRRATLEVERAADGEDGQERYILVRVVSDEAVPLGEEFTIELNRLFLGNPSQGGASGSLLGERDFTCRTQEICDQLADAASEPAQSFNIQMRFSHPPEPTTPLLLTAAGLVEE